MIAGVNFGEWLALGDRIAPLLQADDADRVVDCVLFRAAARAGNSTGRLLSGGTKRDPASVGED